MKLAKRPYKPYTEDELSIRKDEIFRIVFGSNDRYRYLKDFLEGILHRTITNIIIRNDVALNKIHADNKLMRLDILVEVDGKEMINAEMQNKNEYNINERSEVYASGIKGLFAMNRSIEEINRIVDIVMTDNDVMDALNTRILAKNLEQLKQAKAFKDGEESGERENRMLIAKKMLRKGMSDEEIIELTGVADEELIGLKENC